MSNEEPMQHEYAERQDYWYSLNGKGVLIQLVRPYVAVTHPNDPVLQRNEKNEVIGAAALPYLRGILNVYPSKDGPMLELVTADPDERKRAKVYITLHPSMVEFISRTEESPIITTP